MNLEQELDQPMNLEQVEDHTCNLEHVLELTSLYSENLLRHDGQHLQVNTVKLIKARPGPTRRQTLQDKSQRFI